MGKRELAATISGFDHSTAKSCYSSEGITAHLRGWDFGIEITMRVNAWGEPEYDIWSTGGSHDPKAKDQLSLVNRAPRL
jgi:hypothetical protein